MSNLADEIKDYYGKRGLTIPNLYQALGFVNQELGEVYDVVLNMDGNWIRNNPQNHQAKSLSELSDELGDVIMMVMVAGIYNGIDPIDSLREKMRRKLDEFARSNTSTFSVKTELPTQLELFETFGDKDGS